jgi:uncharacterized membrane protein YbhN (UPF0104 family)
VSRVAIEGGQAAPGRNRPPVNALAGAIVHAILLVVFFSWAGRGLGRAFKLPSSSTLLVILSVVAAVIGLVMITRQGRRFAVRKLLPSVRSSLASLRRVARSPVRLALLFSGPAVSAVLLYRLATYWLPVPPGWLSWRLLQRMDYV